MCRNEARTLSQSLTLRYDKVLFVLEPSAVSRPLAGKKVVVCDWQGGVSEQECIDVLRIAFPLSDYLLTPSKIVSCALGGLQSPQSGHQW